MVLAGRWGGLHVPWLREEDFRRPCRFLPVQRLLLGQSFHCCWRLSSRLFGVYKAPLQPSGIRVLQCALASLTCLFIYLCGRDSVGSDAGKLAALVWAIFPLNIFFTVSKVWETSLTGMLVAALFWIMLPLRTSISVSRWFTTGALLGMASPVNTSLVVLVIPFGLAALATQRMRGLRAAVVGALACLAVVSPWLVRNRVEFGKFMLRSNFPLEFSELATTSFPYGQVKIEALHPSNNPSLNRHWQEVGETAFMAEESNSNSSFVSEHPGRFAFSTLNRIANYWTGAWIRPINGFPNVWPVIVPTTILTLVGFLGVARMIATGNSVAYMFTGCLLIYPLCSTLLPDHQPTALLSLLVAAAAHSFQRHLLGNRLQE